MTDKKLSVVEAASLQEIDAFRGARILVVDDEPFNVDLLRFELEDRGFIVITASNGLEALELLGAAQPDLALLDVMMPGLDGYGLTREIRRFPGLEDMPIILLTAQSELADKVEGFAAKADDYVVKPFDIEDVLARVQVQLRIGWYLKRRHSMTLAQSRVAMVGGAAHELAQPLAGASGYLQLLQSSLERNGLDPKVLDSRMASIHSCLIKTREVARRLEQVERVALEDYPCGAQIINLQESALPEENREPDDPHIILLPLEAGSVRDSGLERELVRQGAQMLEEKDLPGRQSEVDLVLLSAQDRADLVGPVLTRVAGYWDAPQIIQPPILALLPGQGLRFGAPGVTLLRLGVDDVLFRPFRLEELVLRIRSRVRLQRLRLGDLRLQSLNAAREVRHLALDGFLPQVDECLAQLRGIAADTPDLKGELIRFSQMVDNLTSAVRRLQARKVPGLGSGNE